MENGNLAKREKKRGVDPSKGWGRLAMGIPIPALAFFLAAVVKNAMSEREGRADPFLFWSSTE